MVVLDGRLEQRRDALDHLDVAHGGSAVVGVLLGRQHGQSHAENLIHVFQIFGVNLDGQIHQRLVQRQHVLGGHRLALGRDTRDGGVECLEHVG